VAASGSDDVLKELTALSSAVLANHSVVLEKIQSFEKRLGNLEKDKQSMWDTM
jgi:hypothetical protein